MDLQTYIERYNDDWIVSISFI